jgi:hypothetical protein
MKNSLYAAMAALALVAGVPVAASAADPAAIPFDGPRPSSLNNWPGMSGSTVPPDEPAASAFAGPRPSSFGNWPGMMGETAPANMPAASPFDGPRPSSAH